MKRRLWSKGFAGTASMPLWGRSGSSLILLLISLGLLMFSGFQPGALSGLRTGTADLFSPLLATISKPIQQASGFVRDVTGLAELQAENLHLKQENVRLREWYQAALLLEAENKSLRDLMNVKVEPRHSFITSRVIADAGNAYVKSLLVSSGIKDGVQKGQAVLSGDGLIGRIVETGKKSSRILLITDINSRVPILVEDSRQHAILAGTNDNFPVLQHTQLDSEIIEGARIVTSGHGGLFPPGLPIGRVVVGEDSKKHVKLYADLRKTAHVRIMNKLGDPNLKRGKPGSVLN